MTQSGRTRREIRCYCHPKAEGRCADHKPLPAACPNTPGRAEFILFDTPDGLACIFVEHITRVRSLLDEGESYGVLFEFSPASGLPPIVKTGVTKLQGRQLVTYILKSFSTGPIWPGRFFDLDWVLSQLAAVQPPGYEQEEGPRIVGLDGQPLKSDGPQLVVAAGITEEEPA